MNEKRHRATSDVGESDPMTAWEATIPCYPCPKGHRTDTNKCPGPCEHYDAWLKEKPKQN